MVGALQMPAPEGPMRFSPVLVAGVWITCCFHTTLPLLASSMTTLPRKEQHAYVGTAAMPSSLEETGTSRRGWPATSANCGEPVRIAAACGSTSLYQACAPLSA